MARQLGRQFKALKTIAKIGQASATVLEVKKLLKTVMNLLEELLDYDHGMILLVQKEKKELEYAAGYGYYKDQEKFLRQMRFDIRGSEAGEYILWSLKEQKPILLNTIGENDNKFPEGFLQFAHQRNVRSLICVPIVYKNESLGVLTVENSSSTKTFTLSDQSLLMGLAFQTAIGISNAQSFQKLQESEARFRKVFDNAASGIALVDLDGHLLEVNNQLARIFGYSEAELLGKTLNDLAHPDDRHIGRKSLKQMMTGEISSTWFEKRYIHMDGRVLWTTNSVTVLQDKSHNSVNFILHVQNLTEQKIAEDEKKQLEAHLQQSQKMEAIGTLAGGIAHDFNNILSAIMGYSDLALLDTEDGTPLSKNLASINAASERAVELVRQILAFSRPSKKDKNPLRINMIVEEALQLIRATLPATIEIRSNIGAAPIAIMGDPTQIHQIVMNLCTNAHHAMLAKGGTLNINLAPVELDYDMVRAYPNLEPGPYVKLSIADSGQGMDADTVNRIFDPYFTTKEKGKGTGLGLAVVHGIVKGHGGFIDVHSKPGKGTMFELFFPKIVESFKPKDSHPDVIPTGSERILFVDDEIVLTELNKETIRRLGYQVECMTSPIEAYEAFCAEPDRFDLVITDMVMPKMTGDQLADKILQIRQDIPIILCTGYNDLITEEKAYKMGIKDFLMKPLAMKDLAYSIRNAIDQAG
jgi:PAS domain S-box-containing protein